MLGPMGSKNNLQGKYNARKNFFVYFSLIINNWRQNFSEQRNCLTFLM